MSVWGNSPGASALTLMPSGAHSTANDLVRLPTPALAAAACAMPGPPVKDWVARMLTIAPPGRSRPVTRRRSSWLQKKVPSSTMLVTERNALGRMEAASTGKLAAALLTRTVGVPSAASSASNASAISSGSRMSAGACAARPPTASTAATPASRCSSDREMTPMAAPARASSTAMARPRPVPPPVTIAVVPSKVPAGRNGDPAGGGSGRPTAATSPRIRPAASWPSRRTRPACRRSRTPRTR